MTAFWGKEANGDRNDTEYKKTFAYDPGYNMLTDVSYKKDNQTSITETFELTSNNKSVASHKKYDTINNVTRQTAQTDYSSYDAYGNNLSKTEYVEPGIGATTSFTYQNGVSLASETRSGATKQYGYDSMGRMLSYTDGNGNATSCQYDGAGRLILKTNPGNPAMSTVATDYDDVGNTVTTTNEIGQKTKCAYDKLGNVKLVQDVTLAPITLNQYFYDSLMRLDYETDSKNTVTSYNYDYLDRITSKTIGAPAVYVETYSYEDVYSSTQSRNTKTIEGDSSAPSVVTCEYVNIYGYTDKKSKYVNSIEYSDTFLYDYLGNNTKITTADGKATQFTYDSSNRLTSTLNPDASSYQTSYDWIGRKVATIDPKGKMATFEYYDSNKLKKEELPFDGVHKTIKSYEYDANGNLTRVEITNNIPGAAKATSKVDYSYDARNLLKKVSQYDNNTLANYITYDYDPAGNLTKMAASDGAIETGYEYDGLGRLEKTVYPLSQSDPLNQFEEYSYDTNGNLKTKIDRNKNTATYEYDMLNRVTGITVEKSTGAAATEYYSYAYSKTGALAQEKNENLTIDFNYDGAGRLVGQTESNGITKTYAYDARGNRAGFALSLNNVNIISQTYTSDAMNRLEKVYENGALAATYAYDASGNRAGLTYNAIGVTTNYTYNDANLVTGVYNKKNGATLSSYVYTYYLNGAQASKTDDLGKATTYAYDDLGQLRREKEVLPGGSYLSKDYDYDKSGNRLEMAVSGSENYTTAYSYDLNNRLTKEVMEMAGGTLTGEYFYDPNGNRVGKLTSSVNAGGNNAPSVSLGLAGEPIGHDYELMAYDAFNRIASADTNGARVEYEYKPDGMRLSKTTNGEKTTHIWDGSNIVLELGLGNSVTDKYVRGAEIIKSGLNGYYLYNEHGDAVQLIDAGGAVSKRYDYDAFGVEIGMDSNDANPFRYCGEYFDKETGSYYLRARHYQPATGRFLTVDPHWNVGNMIYGDGDGTAPNVGAIRQSVNLYTYCMNNPISYTDPNGEFLPVLAAIGIGALIGGSAGFLLGSGSQAIQHGFNFSQWNWRNVGAAAAAGAVTGGFAPLTGGASLAAGGLAGATTAGMYSSVASSALLGGIGYSTYNLVGGYQPTFGGYASSMSFGGALGGLSYGISNSLWSSPYRPPETITVYHGSADNYSSIMNNGFNLSRSPVYVATDRNVAYNAINPLTGRYDITSNSGIISSQIPMLEWNSFIANGSIIQRSYNGWNSTMPGVIEYQLWNEAIMALNRGIFW